MLDLLELLVQRPAVAGDLAEVALDADELLAGARLRVLDDALREAHLARELESEGVAGQADLQLEHRGDLCGVVEHGAVDHVRVGARGVKLEVGVMRGDHSPHAATVELGEDRLGNGAAGRRLRAGAEFVDEHERVLVSVGEHIAHVREEGTVGTQVVLEVLVVADAHGNAVEDRKLGALGCGDEHAPLEHILEQSDRLQADGLAAGVGAGNQQDALLRAQRDGERHDAAPFARERLLQQRVARLAQRQAAIVRDDRHAGHEVERRLRLGHQEVQLADEGGTAQKVGQIGTQEVGELKQDLADLALLLEVELRDVVLQLDDLGGLDEGGLAGGGHVVHEAGQLALGGSAHRDKVFPVADGHVRVGVHDPLLLRLAQDGSGPLGDGGLFVAEVATDLEEMIGGGVLNVAVFVEDGFDAPLHLGEGADRRGQPLELRVDPALDAAEEVQDATDRVGHGLELARGEHIDTGAVTLQGRQEGNGVDVARGREVLLEHQHQAHLVGQREPLPDDVRVRGKALLGHAPGGVIRQAAVGNHLADLVETEFAFQSGVGHSVFSPSSRFRALMDSMGVICPPRTSEMPPVSSLTTITSASHCSEMPRAALWRMP